MRFTMRTTKYSFVKSVFWSTATLYPISKGCSRYCLHLIFVSLCTFCFVFAVCFGNKQPIHVLPYRHGSNQLCLIAQTEFILPGNTFPYHSLYFLHLILFIRERGIIQAQDRFIKGVYFTTSTEHMHKPVHFSEYTL